MRSFTCNMYWLVLDQYSEKLDLGLEVITSMGTFINRGTGLVTSISHKGVLKYSLASCGPAHGTQNLGLSGAVNRWPECKEEAAGRHVGRYAAGSMCLLVLAGAARSLRHREAIVPNEQRPRLELLVRDAFGTGHERLCSRIREHPPWPVQKVSKDVLQHAQLLEIGVGVALFDPLV